MLPSGPGDSRAEFGPSRERSKKLTRVPLKDFSTPSFYHEKCPSYSKISQRQDSTKLLKDFSTPSFYHEKCPSEPGTSGAGYRRNSSTRYDMLDDTAQAPPQQIQAGVPPIAPASPPQPTATPPRSPLPYQLRSGRTHKGAPKKKRGGTRGRR